MKAEADRARLEEREKAEQARLELERTLISQAAEMLDGGEPEEKILRYTRISREKLDRLIESRRN